LSVCACLNALAAASRQAWALGRDQVLPFSPWFRKVWCCAIRIDSSVSSLLTPA
jgi:choline transport protein